MNYANRGKKFESAIKRLFKSYASRGIHCQQNFPERLHDGTLVHHHGFDFQILHNGKFYAFDAKECAGAKWSLANAKPHQVKALYDVYNNGGSAFFWVHFTQKSQLVIFPVAQVVEFLKNGKKSVAPEEGETSTLNYLGIK